MPARTCTSREGASEARPGRKMGHVTCLAPTLAGALATARAIKRDLGIPGAGRCFERRTPTSAPETRPMRLRSRASACWI